MAQVYYDEPGALLLITQPTMSKHCRVALTTHGQYHPLAVSSLLDPPTDSWGRDIKLLLCQLSCTSCFRQRRQIVDINKVDETCTGTQVKQQQSTQCKWGWVNTISHQGHANTYQDILTADIRPFVAVTVLLTSFSSLFNLCSTILRSRSARRFSRSADSASIDKSFSSAQPPQSASSNVPSSLSCRAK